MLLNYSLRLLLSSLRLLFSDEDPLSLSSYFAGPTMALDGLENGQIQGELYYRKLVLYRLNQLFGKYLYSFGLK